MKLKKITVLMMVCFFAMSSLAFAATGGAKSAAPKASPGITSQQKAPEAAAPSQKTNEYKPSTDAKSLQKDAPAAKANTAAADAAKSSSPWGGMMRNIGLFAGGMMLGGLLSSMFGMGAGGMMSDILGLLMNVVMVVAVVMAARFLWTKFKNRNQPADVNPYSSRSEAVQAARRDPVSAAPPVQDALFYDSKTKANEYRNR